LFLCYEPSLSGLGAEGKAVFMVVSITAGVAFDLLSFFLVVTTVKLSASSISSMFGGSVEAAVDDAGFCASSFAA
jgi:hypothetical protein